MVVMPPAAVATRIVASPLRGRLTSPTLELVCLEPTFPTSHLRSESLHLGLSRDPAREPETLAPSPAWSFCREERHGEERAAQVDVLVRTTDCTGGGGRERTYDSALASARRRAWSVVGDEETHLLRETRRITECLLQRTRDLEKALVSVEDENERLKGELADRDKIFAGDELRDILSQDAGMLVACLKNQLADKDVELHRLRSLILTQDTDEQVRALQLQLAERDEQLRRLLAAPVDVAAPPELVGRTRQECLQQAQKIVQNVAELRLQKDEVTKVLDLLSRIEQGATQPEALAHCEGGDNIGPTGKLMAALGVARGVVERLSERQEGITPLTAAARSLVAHRLGDGLKRTERALIEAGANIWAQGTAKPGSRTPHLHDWARHATLSSTPEGLKTCSQQVDEADAESCPEKTGSYRSDAEELKELRALLGDRDESLAAEVAARVAAERRAAKLHAIVEGLSFHDDSASSASALDLRPRAMTPVVTLNVVDCQQRLLSYAPLNVDDEQASSPTVERPPRPPCGGSSPPSADLVGVQAARRLTLLGKETKVALQGTLLSVQSCGS